MPDGVTLVQVDRASGLRAVAGREADLEVFVKGSEPTTYAAMPEEEPGGEPGEEPAEHPGEPVAAPPSEDGVPIPDDAD